MSERQELLAKSCERLIKLFALNSPSCIIVNELKLLTGLAFELLQQQLGDETRKRLRQLRLAKAGGEVPAEAKKGDNAH